MQEKHEILSQFSLCDNLLNYSDKLNNVWNNLIKIQLIDYNNLDDFLDDSWNHLVIKTLCWKYGFIKDELGLATKNSGVGISSGK